MRMELYEAARDGNVQEVKEILRDNPTINVNLGRRFSGETPTSRSTGRMRRIMTARP